MGFFKTLADGALDVMGILADASGLDTPNSLFTEQFRCRDCGLIWYFPKTVKENEKIIPDYKNHKCTKGDGKKHCMVRVR